MALFGLYFPFDSLSYLFQQSIAVRLKPMSKRSVIREGRAQNLQRPGDLDPNASFPLDEAQKGVEITGSVLTSSPFRVEGLPAAIRDPKQISSLPLQEQ